MATLRREVALTSNSTIKVYADETQVDVANNRSYITTSLAIWTRGGASATSYNANVTGGNGASGSLSVGAGETTLVSGGFWATHNSDGSGSVTVGSFFTSTWKSMGYGEFSFTLTNIPRASQPSINTYPNNSPNIKAGVSCWIHMNRVSTSFTHKVTYSIGSASGTIASSGVTDNVVWTPPTSLCAQFPNATSKSGTITVTTYNGSTIIGTKTCTFNLSIPDDSKPTLSSQTVTETNSYVRAKDDSITLQQISSKSVSVKASAKYSASVSRVTCNGVSLTNNSGTWSGTLSNLSTGTFMFTVTDSRGLTASVSVDTTYYEYSKPQLTEGSLTREEQTSSNGMLNVKGIFKDILSNTVTMTYERKVNGNSEGQMSVTPTVSSGDVSYTQDYTDLYYTKSYDVTITITDSFGEVSSATIHLGTGVFAMWLGKTEVKMGGDLTVCGTHKASVVDLTGTSIQINGVSFKIVIT